MTTNLLKLNEDKTELIYFQSKFLREPITFPSLNLGGNTIQPAPVVKNLGFYLDVHLDMDKHVNHVIKTCCFHIRAIGKIRKYLDIDMCKTLVNAIVTSRLDYCNALLKGVNKKLLLRVQRVQNMAARMVSRKPPEIDDDLILKELHWLPIEQRIDFKFLVYVYKCQNDIATSYLCELLQSYTPARTLRPTREHLLSQTLERKKVYVGRAFTTAAPELWNKLPASVRSQETLSGFKKTLKTHLFKLYFNSPNRC